MAVSIDSIIDQNQVWDNLLAKWGVSSVQYLIQTITTQTGITDGGSNLDLTDTTKGDVIYDFDNDDYYIVTVTGTTVTNLN